MPRKPREFVEEGIYHIFNRGNNRRILFKTKTDFDYFLKLLEKASAKHPVQIYHYCLMTNHFHLLLRASTCDSVPCFMHWLQLGYARYFKRKYCTTGHLFEERYRSPRILEDSYHLQCGRYIERNPVKAKLVSQAWEYANSSAQYYVKGKKDPLVTANPHYLDMGFSDAERMENYQKFLLFDEPYSPMINAELLKY